MTTAEITAAAAVFFTGTTGWLTWMLNRRNSTRDDVKLLLETWQKDNDRLRQQVNELLDRESKLQATLQSVTGELKELKLKMLLVESTSMDFPFPSWLKDRDGIVLTCNSHFEERFLRPIGKTTSDLIGSTEANLFGDELGKQLSASDKAALKSDNGLWSGQDRPGWLTIKYVRYAAGIKIGVAGICVPAV